MAKIPQIAIVYHSDRTGLSTGLVVNGKHLGDLDRDDWMALSKSIAETHALLPRNWFQRILWRFACPYATRFD